MPAGRQNQRIVTLAVLLVLAALPVLAQSPTAPDIRQARPVRAADSYAFAGVWKLVAVRATREDRTWNEEAWGRNPKGFLVYTPDGWMTAVVSYGGRKSLSTPDRFQATPEEKAAAYETSFSYAGRYEVAGGKVIHHVEVSSVENWVNTKLIRNFRFDGTRLVLRTPPLPSRERRAAEFELIWERAGGASPATRDRLDPDKP